MQEEVPTTRLYTIRVDVGHLDDHVERFNTFCCQSQDDWIRSCIFYEISTKKKKEHYQGFIEVPLYRITAYLDALRKRLKRAFNVEKRHEYGIKEVLEPHKYENYVAKDGDVRHSKGCNADKLIERSASEWAVKKELYKLQKAKKDKPAPYAKVVLEYCKENEDMFITDVYEDPSWDVGVSKLVIGEERKTYRQLDPIKLLRVIQSKFSSDIKVFDEFIVLRQYNLVLAYYDPERSLSHILGRMAEKGYDLVPRRLDPPK